MKLSKALVCAVAVMVLLSACASNVRKEGGTPIKLGPDASNAVVLNITGSRDSVTAPEWASFKNLWNDSCRHEAASFTSAFSLQLDDPRATGEAGTLLVVDVVDYRYITAGMRYGLGVMTGNAYINANVSVRDLKSGDLWGYKPYDTTSTAWQGVFSAMTEKQVAAVCHEIFKDLARTN